MGVPALTIRRHSGRRASGDPESRHKLYGSVWIPGSRFQRAPE
jgi:hypothetical protein